ncbi:MAG: diacylglycerol kinase family lipid kinase [Bacteroidales bacterium]|nr:diacylglycerol kinase family lipid kinase [Bacteroidales bacterium]
MNKKERGETWLVVVNPNAGSKKGKKDWDIISALLLKHNISYSQRFTEGKRHAIEITREVIREGYRRLIVVGGDGTMNEVINGVFTQDDCRTTDVTIAMITVGTGNDWGKMFGVPMEYEDAIKLITANRICLQDSGVVTYYNGTELEKRHFLNIAGLGFDALVVRRTNRAKDRGRSSKAIYYWTLLRSLFSYGHTSTEVIIDGNRVSNDTFSISLGIGRYSGGGMMQTPNAVVNDGLFDITIIKKMRKGEIIRSLKKLYDGTILDHPKIEGYIGKSVRIDSDPVIHVEADGESLGHSPIEFTIIPDSVNVICRSPVCSDKNSE